MQALIKNKKQNTKSSKLTKLWPENQFLSQGYLLKPFSGLENRSLTKSQKPLEKGYP
jgi:hypothetical protein